MVGLNGVSGGEVCRAAMILGNKLSVIGAGRLLVLDLRGHA
jgi:hypothetical protein